jgi:hypothetical protein
VKLLEWVPSIYLETETPETPQLFFGHTVFPYISFCLLYFIGKKKSFSLPVTFTKVTDCGLEDRDPIASEGTTSQLALGNAKPLIP